MFKQLTLIAALLMGTAATAQDYGNWQIYESRDQMTDFQNITAVIKSSNDVRHRWAHQRQDGKSELRIRCVDNSTALTIDMDGQFMSDLQFGDVRIRIDDGETRTYNFVESTNNMVLGKWRGSGIPLIKSFEDATTIRFDFAAHGENRQVMVFDVNGINEVINEVRDRCSW